MQAEPPAPVQPGGGDSEMSDTAAAAAVEGAEQPTVQQLPCHLTDDQYSAAAFKALLDSTAATAARGQSLTSMFDRSSLLDVIADASLPLQDRVALLQEGAVPAAAVPVRVLLQLVQAGVATESWNNTPATDWVTENWSSLTTDQVRCKLFLSSSQLFDCRCSGLHRIVCLPASNT